MALKKSNLYSSLWKSCDELRGGMDASQYKDYILTLLFMKYISDKAKTVPDSLIVVPEGGSFDDMLAARGKPNIGERFEEIIGKLAETNELVNVIDLADFNDPEKLGTEVNLIRRVLRLHPRTINFLWSRKRTIDCVIGEVGLGCDSSQKRDRACPSPTPQGRTIIPRALSVIPLFTLYSRHRTYS